MIEFGHIFKIPKISVNICGISAALAYTGILPSSN